MKKSLKEIFAATLLIGTILSGNALAEEAPETTAQTKELSEQMDLFKEVLRMAQENHVRKDLSLTKMIEGALKGMAKSLDPHSDYINAEEYKNMMTRTSGKFGGLGIQVSMDGDFVKVISPIDDTPAFKAGVKAGDYVTHIDGKSIIGLTLTEAVKKMRGDRGSKVTLTIVRKDSKDPLEIDIIRDIIRSNPVTSRMIGNEIGYIRLSTFNKTTGPGVEQAVEKLKKASLEKTGQEPSAYILDMRNNPGGLLRQSIKVSDHFIKSGVIVSLGDEEEKDNAGAFWARPGDIVNGKPMVVLINKGSASASEIVAGALQDSGRALILGTQSFGKGSVQTIFPLGRNKGALKVTTQHYFTQSGDSIQNNGITPNTRFEDLNAKTGKSGLREKDLRGTLLNPNLEQDKTRTTATCSPRPDADVKNMHESVLGRDGKADYPLLCAIAHLRDLNVHTVTKPLNNTPKPSP